MSSKQMLTKKIVPDGDSLLSLDINEDVAVFTSENGQISLHKSTSDLASISSLILQPSTESTSAIITKKTPNNIYCASANSIYLLDSRKFTEPIQKHTFNTDDINQIALSPDENFLFSADDSGSIQVINLEKNSLEKTLSKHKNVCFTIQTRPNRFSELISGGYDCNLMAWDFKRGKVMQEFNMKTDLPFMNPPYVLDLGFNNCGSILAVALQDGSIHFWNAKKPKMKYSDCILNAHFSLGTTQVEFLDDVCLVSSGNDGIINLWNGDVQHKIESINHGEKINALRTTLLEKHDTLLVCDTTPNATLYHLM